MVLMCLVGIYLSTGARIAAIVLTVVLSNTLFKLGAVAVMGSRRLLALVAMASGVVITIGVATLLVWP